MKNIQPLLVILVPYFTVCGCIYHMVYWDTFHLNGLAYLAVSDILKSFVYPFLAFSVFALLGFFYNELIGMNRLFPSGGGRETPVGKRLNSKPGIVISLILWAVMVYLLYHRGGVDRWIFWGFWVSFVPIVMIDRSGVLNSIVSNHHYRIQVIRLLVIIPVFSFAAGKYQGELIDKNIQYRYTVSTQSDTLKLIGQTDRQTFLKSLHSNTLFIIHSDKIDTLILREKAY